MEQRRRKFTLLFTAVLVLLIAAISIGSLLSVRGRIKEEQQIARPIFDPEKIESLTAVYVYEPPLGVAESGSTPLENWPYVRITDKATIEHLCTLLVAAVGEPQRKDKGGATYWELVLNDTDRILLKSSTVYNCCTMVCGATHWDMPLQETQALSDALASLITPASADDIVSVTHSTLSKRRIGKTTELQGEALELARQLADRFFTEAEQTEGYQLDSLATIATHKLRFTFSDGSAFVLRYVPFPVNHNRILLDWHVNSGFLAMRTDCYTLAGENDPFAELFALLEDTP